jgi:flagellar basal-body rod protein FlgB
MTALFAETGVMRRALNYHLERQNILASNIANVDTPGFRPLELVRETEPTEGASMPMRTSNTPHRTRGGFFQDRDYVLREQTVQPGADQNGVSLEREMSKLAANDIRYDGTTRMVRLHLGILRYAANDGS